MNKRPILGIRHARQSDAQVIAELAQSQTLSTKETQGAGRGGFLVSGFTSDQYDAFILSQAPILIIESDGQIAGFIFLLTRESRELWDPVSESAFFEFNHHNVLVIKQVCIDERFQGQGIGKWLYQHLAQRFSGRSLFAAIVTNPRNEGSIAFHERLGFRNIYEISGADGLERGMWARFPNNLPESMRCS